MSVARARKEINLVEFMYWQAFYNIANGTQEQSPEEQMTLLDCYVRNLEDG